MIKDRLFIFLAIILIILFTVTILENIVNLSRPRLESSSAPTESIVEILTRLEEAGLEPREAEYYVIEGERNE